MYEIFFQKFNAKAPLGNIRQNENWHNCLFAVNFFYLESIALK